MTQVSFYFGASDRLAAAADWLSQRSPSAPWVGVLLPSSDMVEYLDRLLWTRNALSFTAHCHAPSPLAEETPVVLSMKVQEILARPCWLNLTDTLPMQLENCAQLVEIVSQDSGDRERARERFRTYRSLGYPIDSIDLSQPPSP